MPDILGIIGRLFASVDIGQLGQLSGLANPIALCILGVIVLWVILLCAVNRGTFL